MDYENIRGFARKIALESLKNKGMTKTAAAFAIPFLMAALKWIGALAAMYGVFKTFEHSPYLYSYLRRGKYESDLLPEEKKYYDEYRSRGYSPLYSQEMAKRTAALIQGASGEQIKDIEEMPSELRKKLYHWEIPHRREIMEHMSQLPEELTKQHHALTERDERVLKIFNVLASRIKDLEQRIDSHAPQGVQQPVDPLQELKMSLLADLQRMGAKPLGPVGLGLPG